jgi:hypothetical protein
VVNGTLPGHGPPRPFRFGCLDALLDRPDWTGMRVLDVGGDGGEILRDPEARIDPSTYRCVDGDLATLPVDGLGEFDAILAYSVFTRTGWARMRAAVHRLRGLLAPGGRLAFTFLDPWWTAPPRWVRTSLEPPRCNLAWCLERYLEVNPAARLDVPAIVAGLAGVDHLALRGDGGECIAFYTAAHIRRWFPDARVVAPVRPVRQHGAVLSRQASTRRRYQMPSTTKSSMPRDVQYATRSDIELTKPAPRKLSEVLQSTA